MTRGLSMFRGGNDGRYAGYGSDGRAGIRTWSHSSTDGRERLAAGTYSTWGTRRANRWSEVASRSRPNSRTVTTKLASVKLRRWSRNRRNTSHVGSKTALQGRSRSTPEGPGEAAVGTDATNLRARSTALGTESG